MRRTLQYIVLFAQAFVGKHSKPIIFSTLLGFFAALLFIQVYPFYRTALSRKNYTIGLVGNYTKQTVPHSVQQKISIGLTGLTDTKEATPSLALSWEVDEKGTTYLFHLKEHLFWHDGKPFTADDIHYTFRGAQFSTIDPFTLKITLTEPYVPLPVLLSAPLIRPNFVGLGPYKATRTAFEGERLTSITLTHDSETIPILTYKFYPSVDQAILAFKLGEIDSVESVPDIGVLSSWKNVETKETVQYDRFVGLFFNVQNPMVKEKDVRQALAYALPDWVDEQEALTPISPLSWAYSTKVRLYHYDPDTAKKILAKSPLASDSAELVISTFPQFLRTAQTVSEAWNAVGLRTRIRVENEITSQFDTFILAQAIPPDPDQYQYWQSQQEGTNITHYNSQKIDKLLEDGRQKQDQNERKKIYADFQRYIVDDVPVIPLYYPTVYTVERK